MRVRASATGFYTYPDVVVVCGERQFVDDQRDTLLNPNLIVEVLSPTTEAYDRSRKFEFYKAIESFTEYLLISSDRVHVDLFRRRGAAIGC
jgi:Uma2 family endonuclease